MIRELVMALCLLVTGCVTVPAFAAEADGKKAAELSWAKGVAEDFLEAAFAGRVEQAQTLIDSSLKSSFAKEGEPRLAEWLDNSIAIQGFHDPVIRTEVIAPTRMRLHSRGRSNEPKRRCNSPSTSSKTKRAVSGASATFSFVSRMRRSSESWRRFGDN